MLFGALGAFEEDFCGVDGFGEAFEHPPPPEVAWQISGGDAVERLHPCLEAAVIGVDVLDMEDAVSNILASGDVDRLMSDADLTRNDAIGATGIGA